MWRQLKPYPNSPKRQKRPSKKFKIQDPAPIYDHALLPDESAIAAVTLAELAAGPHAANDEMEKARRQDRLQWAAALWDPLPFDSSAARAYGRVFAATKAAGRSSRTRLADLLIASTAAANGLPLYTRNPSDFAGLDGIVAVIAV